VPLHPPEATQVSAFVLDQVSVLLPPAVTLAGCALSCTVGAGVLPSSPPPPPLQLASDMATEMAAAAATPRCRMIERAGMLRSLTFRQVVL
jgi:hypothetical protein